MQGFSGRAARHAGGWAVKTFARHRVSEAFPPNYYRPRAPTPALGSHIGFGPGSSSGFGSGSDFGSGSGFGFGFGLD